MWAQAVVALAAAAMVIGAVLAIGGVALLDRIEAGAATNDEITGWVRSTEGIANAAMLLHVLGALCVLTWLHRAVANAPALGRGTPRWSPGQAVVWWFVPVAFLVVPWQVVRDLWRRMSPAGVAARSEIVSIWWLLYLGGSLTGRAVDTIYRDASTPADFKGSLVMTAAAVGAVAVSGILLVRIIRAVEAHADELALQIPAAPVTSRGIPLPAAPFVTTDLTGDPPERFPAVAFCPRCATRRLRDARYCAACAFDFREVW
jgi:hypothetical protein